MKPILIPPLHHFWDVMNQEWHLCLSHLVENPDYFEFYRSEAERGKKIILDNSAHEMGHGQPMELLLEQGWSLGVEEIVLPDSLFDDLATVERTSQAFDDLGKFPFSWRPKSVMVVPQGKTFDDWVWCFRTLLDAYTNARAKYRSWVPNLTVGVSKDYHDLPGFGSSLFRIFEEVVLPARDESMYFDIHLLGWPKPLWDLAEIARRYGDLIRTTDTARPYTFGFAKIELDLREDPPPYPGRPENFFTAKLQRGQFQPAQSNIRLYKRLVQGEMLWPSPTPVEIREEQ